MTEKRFWLVPMDYYGEQRFVRDNNLIGEKSLSNEEVVDLLNEQETKLKRIEKEVDCNVYHDDLKDIVLEIRCILNGDCE